MVQFFIILILIILIIIALISDKDAPVYDEEEEFEEDAELKRDVFQVEYMPYNDSYSPKVNGGYLFHDGNGEITDVPNGNRKILVKSKEAAILMLRLFKEQQGKGNHIETIQL